MAASFLTTSTEIFTAPSFSRLFNFASRFDTSPFSFSSSRRLAAIFDAAIRQHQVALVVTGVVTVACGFYYYFKVIRAMYWETGTMDAAVPLSRLSHWAMSAMVAGIIFLGVYPQPILNALKH